MVEQGQVEMLVRNARKMREAGGALRSPRSGLIPEYDGLHRLSLAVAEWQKVIASEGGRDVRHGAQETPTLDLSGIPTCISCKHSWTWTRPSFQRCGRGGSGG